MVDIILDVDSVGDDILAIIYAALNKEINVLGITTVNGACGSIEQAVKVALNIVKLTGKDIPVYKGEAEAIKIKKPNVNGDPVNFDEELRWKLKDRLNGFNAPEKEPTNQVETISAIDFIVNSFNERPNEITLVTTGPMTNIARALEKDASIAKRVKHAYILGGCFHSPGNITPVSEYNIWADPEAAKIVLNSDMAITLVPLDVCEDNKVAAGMLTRDHIADLNNYGSSEIINYITNKFPIYIDIWREFFQLGGFPMDDVITVALAANPELCSYSENVFVDIETEGEIARGQTVAYFGKQIIKNELKEHRNTRIATNILGKEFMNLFVDTVLESSKN